MARAIDAISARYAALGRQRIEVPEWSLTVWASPYTVRDEARMAEHLRTDSPEGWIELLVLKAEDEEDKPLFTAADKPALRRRAEAHVLKRVGAAIIAGANISLEEAEGNSETPTSPGCSE